MRNDTPPGFKPKTDFEKFLFANDYIKVLKNEIKALNFNVGILNSDYTELIDTSRGARVRDAQQIQISALEAKNKKLKLKNDELMKELIKLRLIININDED